MSYSGAGCIFVKKKKIQFKIYVDSLVHTFFFVKSYMFICWKYEFNVGGGLVSKRISERQGPRKVQLSAGQILIVGQSA